jgi:hypothetical protein
MAALNFSTGKLERTVLLTFALLALVFLALALFCRPAADDYTFAYLANRDGLLGGVRTMYTAWSGRFFSTLVMLAAMRPESSVTNMYSLVPIGTMLLLAGSFYWIASLLARDVIRRVQASLLLFVLYSALMPSPTEGYYWAAGAITYQLGNALFLILHCLLFTVLRTQTVAQRLLLFMICVPVAVAVCGSNEVIMLMTVVTLAIGSAQLLARRNGAAWIWIALLLVSAATAVAVINAPGNAVRGNAFPNAHNLFYATSRSFMRVLFFAHMWLLSPALLATLPFLSAISRPVWKGMQQTSLFARWPGSVGAIWFGLLAMTFFPAYWAMGEQVPVRIVNTVFLFFLLGFPLALQGLIEQFGGAALLESLLTRKSLAISLAVCAFLVLESRNFPQAVHDLIRFARPYQVQSDLRTAQLRDAAQKRIPTVTLKPLGRLPKTIVSSDLEASPADWKNAAVARYFGLESVAVAPRTR